MEISNIEDCKRLVSQYNEFEELVLEKLDLFAEIMRRNRPMGAIEEMYANVDKGLLHVDVYGMPDDRFGESYNLPVEFLFDPMFPSIYRIPFDKKFKKEEEEKAIRILMRDDKREKKEYERLKQKFEPTTQEESWSSD